MLVNPEDIKGLLDSVKKYKTIREGASAFRCASAKDPTLDKRSFGAGYEEGIYYAIDILCGTEWVENHLTTEE
ncbi:MAG: hypothetical protein IKT27_05960 [Clostridia bacterium]|jgi:hypothetical protein|nr:hypothetical protein [Clostridia bacterium]